MDSLIELFHIDTKLLLAQAINFLIVFSVLWFFALKPVMAIMKERTDKIEKSLKQAKDIEEKLAAAQKEKHKITVEANKQANELLEKTKNDAEEKKKAMVNQAKEEVEKVVAEGKRQLSAEKAKMIDEAKADISELVIMAAEKIIAKKMDVKGDQEFVSKALKELKK